MPYSYKEDLLRRELNLLDFNKLAPEALNELVSQEGCHKIV